VIIAAAIVYFLVHWPRFVTQQGQLVHTISFGVGIPAALIILAVVGNEWREFSGAYAELQAELISSLQDSYKHSLQGDAFPPINKEKDGVLIHTDLRGLNYAVYTATRKDLPGRLIATARRDGGEIKWAVPGSERTTLDVKLGTIRTVGEDRFQLILQSGDIIEGKPDDMQYELIEGRMGFAVIPYGSDKLAALYPLEEMIVDNN